jgi:DNA-binding PadR family transcriptional regulator
MEDVDRLPRSPYGSPRSKKSAISLKESAFFEYRWYRILEALHRHGGDDSLEGLVKSLKEMGAGADEALLREDLLRLEEHEYVESHKEHDFPHVRRLKLTPLGEEKVKRVLRKL